MNNYSQYTINALRRIFNQTSELGFWDESNNRIISHLEHDINFKWSLIVNNSETDRYGVFAVSKILLSYLLYKSTLDSFDHKIINYLNYIKFNFYKYNISVLTYGAFNALVLGQILFESKKVDYSIEIEYAIRKFREQLREVDNNESALVLIGLTLYYNYLHKDEEVYAYIKVLTTQLIKNQDANGYFVTGDIRAIYHQRTMYVLWALIFASTITQRAEIQSAVERSLKYIWSFRLERIDNAFVWHPSFFLAKSKHLGILLPIYNPRSAQYLFECHQSFFAISVLFYNYFYNEKKFIHEAIAAMDWIFGNNRLGKNLVTLSGIEVPLRIMDKKGNLFIKRQNFKGSYEIGAYILAINIYKFKQVHLTNLM